MRVALLDLARPLTDLDLGDDDEILGLVVAGTRPLGRVVLRARRSDATPRTIRAAALERAIRERLGTALRAASAERALRQALGGEWWRQSGRPTVTVAVRSTSEPALEGCLCAIAELEQGPERLVVVDREGEPFARRLAERHGAEYLRAAGTFARAVLGRCETEVIFGIEDLCRPGGAWLNQVGRHFNDPLVVAAAGLEWPAPEMGEVGPPGDGVLAWGDQPFLRVVDWQRAPAAPMALVPESNLGFRVSWLRERSAVAPTDDQDVASVLVAQAIRDGYRLIQDPTQLVWRHARPDAHDARRQARARGRAAGRSSGAMLADGEAVGARHGLTALWPASRELTSATTGSGISLELELVRGWAEGARAGRRRATAVGTDEGAQSRVAGLPPPGRLGGRAGSSPEVTVIVPTIPSRADALERCLLALSQQTLARERYEIVVVPNGPGAQKVVGHRLADGVVPLSTPSLSAARNAGVAAARSELVVFCDDDLIAEPTGLAEYLTMHEREPDAVLLGAYPPARIGDTLAEKWVGRWWFDHFTRKFRPGHHFTFTDFAGGWIAIPRRIFDTLRFDETFDSRYRREDWELSCRLLAAGGRYALAPRAVAWHHYEMTVDKVLKDKLAEGYADTVLAERHPAVLHDLWIAEIASPGRVGSPKWEASTRAATAALGPMADLTRSFLSRLERRGLTGRWRRSIGLLSAAYYSLGIQRALDDGHRLPRAGPLRQQTIIDPAHPAPIETGVTVGEVVLQWHGLALGAFRLPESQWDAEAIIEYGTSLIAWLGPPSFQGELGRLAP